MFILCVLSLSLSLHTDRQTSCVPDSLLLLQANRWQQPASCSSAYSQTLYHYPICGASTQQQATKWERERERANGSLKLIARSFSFKLQVKWLFVSLCAHTNCRRRTTKRQHRQQRLQAQGQFDRSHQTRIISITV